ncbi:MAG: NAD(P)/FAD-dependent oxidoreductase [Burkholderiales bacterium]
MPQRFDAIVVGAGAAGLFCAGVAAQRGVRVALVDHAPRLAEKIRISGGGRCNFTNLEADRPERFVSEDPKFARAALRAYGPRRFVALVEAHDIGWHEKHRGQLFCDDSSERIVELLRTECDRGGVAWFRPCAVHEVERHDAPVEPRDRFVLRTDAGELSARALVIATGGPSIPQIGATDWGHRLAGRFGLRVVEPRPALVPLTFTSQSWQPFAELAGLALEVGIATPDTPGAPAFVEDLLFTHRGLSGPAVLQASTYWRPGEPLSIDLAPGARIGEALRTAREGTRQQLGTALAAVVPKRLAPAWLGAEGERKLAELGNRALDTLAARLHDWRVTPAGTEGWRKAEVATGGVATDELDARTLESRRVPGLHFVGEVVDVTGWLGGYNFQWAWASGWCAAQALARG